MCAVRMRDYDVIKTFLTSSSLFIILLSPAKESPCLNQERNMHRSCLQVKKVQNCLKQICQWILMWEDNRRRKRILWCFYQLFGLSLWRHPFTPEEPLASKWREGIFSPNMFRWRNKLISILDGLRVRTFSFWGWLFLYFFFFFSLLAWLLLQFQILNNYECWLNRHVFGLNS